MKSYDEVKKAQESQRKLCTDRKLPHFAPSNGVCWSCRRQIYDVETGESYITGCCFCHRSFCD